MSSKPRTAQSPCLPRVLVLLAMTATVLTVPVSTAVMYRVDALDVVLLSRFIPRISDSVCSACKLSMLVYLVTCDRRHHGFAPVCTWCALCVAPSVRSNYCTLQSVTGLSHHLVTHICVISHCVFCRWHTLLLMGYNTRIGDHKIRACGVSGCLQSMSSHCLFECPCRRVATTPLDQNTPTHSHYQIQPGTPSRSYTRTCGQPQIVHKI